MENFLGIPLPVLAAQILVGLMNGAFYAALTVGLAIIFGLLNMINFAHGAMYMLGAFIAWYLLSNFGIGYWGALILAPVVAGFVGVLIERTLLARIKGADHLYGLLLTFGIALMIESLVRANYGSSGLPYAAPSALEGGIALPFMFLPFYRTWVIACACGVCLLTWLALEKTDLGARLRAAIEDADLLQTLGVNVPVMVTFTYAFGVALASLAGVLMAPVYSVHPSMGSEIIIVIFAIVVIGGMGSIVGSIITALTMGVVETFVKFFYAPGASMVVFVIMILVLLVRPQGLFGAPENKL